MEKGNLYSEFPCRGDYHTFWLKATFSRPEDYNRFFRESKKKSLLIKPFSKLAIINQLAPVDIVCEEGVEDGEEKGGSFARA